MGKFATFCKWIVKKDISSIFSICYCQIGNVVYSAIYVQANVLYVISFWINVFQPIHGAVYLGEVQRFMAHFIIIVEMVSISLDS